MDATIPDLKRGWLKVQKKTAFFSSWKPRYIVLDSGRINYYKKRLPVNEKPYGDIERGGMILQDAVMIEKLTYSTIELIVKIGKEKHLVLQGENINDMIEWRNAFKSHIDYLKLASLTSTKSDTSYSSGMSKQLSFKVSHGSSPMNSVAMSQTTANNQMSTTPIQTPPVSTTPAGSRQGSPINRSRSVSTTSQTTAGTDYITPQPGFVMKTINNKKERVFINICHHASLPVTSLQSGLFGGTSKWPFMISPPGRLEENYHAHRHTSSSNNSSMSATGSSSRVKNDEVMVYDVVMHTSVVELIMLDNNAPTRDMVCARAIECINAKHKGNLTGQFSLPAVGRTYVGQVDFVSLSCNNATTPSATDTNRSMKSTTNADIHQSQNSANGNSEDPQSNQSSFTLTSFIRTSSSRLIGGSSSTNGSSSNNMAAVNTATATSTVSSANSSPIRSSQQKQIAALTLVQPTHSSLNSPITGANISPIRSSQQRLTGSNSPLRASQQKTAFSLFSNVVDSPPSSPVPVTVTMPLQSALSIKDNSKSNNGIQQTSNNSNNNSPFNSPLKKSASFRLRFSLPNDSNNEDKDEKDEKVDDDDNENKKGMGIAEKPQESVTVTSTPSIPISPSPADTVASVSSVDGVKTASAMIVSDMNQTVQLVSTLPPPPSSPLLSIPQPQLPMSSGKVSSSRRKSCLGGVVAVDVVTPPPPPAATVGSAAVGTIAGTVEGVIVPSSLVLVNQLIDTTAMTSVSCPPVEKEVEKEVVGGDGDESSINLYSSGKIDDDINNNNNNMLSSSSSSIDALTLLSSQMLFTFTNTAKSDSESTMSSKSSHISPRQHQQQEPPQYNNEKKQSNRDKKNCNKDDDGDDMWAPPGLSITYTACGMECSIQ